MICADEFSTQKFTNFSENNFFQLCDTCDHKSAIKHIPRDGTDPSHCLVTVTYTVKCIQPFEPRCTVARTFCIRKY